MRSASASTSGRLDEAASSLDASPSSYSLDCLVKLGGSAITVKEALETMDEHGLASGCQAVRDAAVHGGGTVVVVHGAGSFGHFHASQSGVAKVRAVSCILPGNDGGLYGVRWCVRRLLQTPTCRLDGVWARSLSTTCTVPSEVLGRGWEVSQAQGCVCVLVVEVRRSEDICGGGAHEPSARTQQGRVVRFWVETGVRVGGGSAREEGGLCRARSDRMQDGL